jgi:hypothetical protein
MIPDELFVERRRAFWLTLLRVKVTKWDYVRIASRGCLMVTLVASNTVFIAHHQLMPAAIGAFFISALWWINSSQHRPDARFGWLAYGLGAAVGTVTGTVLASYIAK